MTAILWTASCGPKSPEAQRRISTFCLGISPFHSVMTHVLFVDDLTIKICLRWGRECVIHWWSSNINLKCCRKQLCFLCVWCKKIALYIVSNIFYFFCLYIYFITFLFVVVFITLLLFVKTFLYLAIFCFTTEISYSYILSLDKEIYQTYPHFAVFNPITHSEVVILPSYPALSLCDVSFTTTIYRLLLSRYIASYLLVSVVGNQCKNLLCRDEIKCREKSLFCMTFLRRTCVKNDHFTGGGR